LPGSRSSQGRGHGVKGVLPENAYSLIFLMFFGEVVNLEFPAILAAEGNPDA
jgi:hypothetical protein